MKPNTIELDEKGIFCYEAPEKPSKYLRVDDEYQVALEQAKHDRVYFKEQEGIVQLLIDDDLLPCEEDFKQGKQYPIPDGYDIEIQKEDEFGNRCYSVFECKCKPYAILVPKEKVCKDVRVNGGVYSPDCCNNPDNCSNTKQQSIEEAADEYAKDFDNRSWAKMSFIAGAKSQVAKIEELIVVIKQKENLLIDAYKRIEQFKQEKQ